LRNLPKCVVKVLAVYLFYAKRRRVQVFFKAEERDKTFFDVFFEKIGKTALN
jgi:hypothetical protein